jgi:hypothetical protein
METWPIAMYFHAYRKVGKYRIMKDFETNVWAICLNHSNLIKKDFKILFYFLITHLKESSTLSGLNLEQLTK